MTALGNANSIEGLLRAMKSSDFEKNDEELVDWLVAGFEAMTQPPSWKQPRQIPPEPCEVHSGYRPRRFLQNAVAAEHCAPKVEEVRPSDC